MFGGGVGGVAGFAGEVDDFGLARWRGVFGGKEDWPQEGTKSTKENG